MKIVASVKNTINSQSYIICQSHYDEEHWISIEVRNNVVHLKKHLYPLPTIDEKEWIVFEQNLIPLFIYHLTKEEERRQVIDRLNVLKRKHNIE